MYFGIFFLVRGDVNVIRIGVFGKYRIIIFIGANFVKSICDIFLLEVSVFWVYLDVGEDNMWNNSCRRILVFFD